MTGHSLGLGAAFAASTLLVAAAASAQAGAGQPPPAADAPGGPPSGAPATGAASLSVGGGTADAEADTADKTGEQDKPKKGDRLAWRNTNFVWDQSASGETVGIGQDYLSKNPSYEMTFSLQPNYYVYEDDEQQIAVRADLGAFREFTNSDTTTKRGEWSLTDFTLLGAYSRLLYTDGDWGTLFSLRAPVLSFPTSKISAASGKILGLGASVGLGQSVPLAGSDSSVFQTFSLQGTAGYTHTFTEAIVPTNTDLQRVRMDPEGRAIPGDQLSGVAYAKHQATFGIAGELQITDRVTWGNSFSWRPSWKYELPEADVCSDQLLATGCVPSDRVDDPQRFTVVTLFASEVGVQVMNEMSVAVGYANLAPQLGPDGQRRNIFYSPYARVYLSVVAHIDEIYQTATGANRGTEEVETAGELAKRKGSRRTY